MKIRRSGSIALTASAVAIVALMAGSLPVTVNFSTLTLDDNAALAGNGKGNNGNGHGNGGSSGNNGNGNSGNADGAGADTASNGNANANANANGHNLNDLDGDGIDGVSANELGRLNAAHASASGLANASESSAVGNVAGYSANVQEGNLADAATDFGEAANKSVTEAIVHAVNDLLGIDDNAVAMPEGEDAGAVDAAEGEGEGDMVDAEMEGDGEGGLTVHDTEPEIAARVNGTFGEDDADQAAEHDS